MARLASTLWSAGADRHSLVDPLLDSLQGGGPGHAGPDPQPNAVPAAAPCNVTTRPPRRACWRLPGDSDWQRFRLGGQRLRPPCCDRPAPAMTAGCRAAKGPGAARSALLRGSWGGRAAAPTIVIRGRVTQAIVIDASPVPRWRRNWPCCASRGITRPPDVARHRLRRPTWANASISLGRAQPTSSSLPCRACLEVGTAEPLSPAPRQHQDRLRVLWYDSHVRAADATRSLAFRDDALRPNAAECASSSTCQYLCAATGLAIFDRTALRC